MLPLFFILLITILSLAVCLGCFLRMRNDIDVLVSISESQRIILENLMQRRVTHGQMDEYLKKIDDKILELSEVKNKNRQDKWASFHKAFGSKEIEEAD